MLDELLDGERRYYLVGGRRGGSYIDEVTDVKLANISTLSCDIRSVNEALR